MLFGRCWFRGLMPNSEICVAFTRTKQSDCLDLQRFPSKKNVWQSVGRSVCSRGIWKITKNFDGFRDSRHLSDFQNMSEMGRCGWLEVMYPPENTENGWL